MTAMTQTFLKQVDSITVFGDIAGGLRIVTELDVDDVPVYLAETANAPAADEFQPTSERAVWREEN